MIVQVEIEKHFTGGTLEGLQHVARVGFPDLRSARRYAGQMRGRWVDNAPFGGSPYRVARAEVVEAGQ